MTDLLALLTEHQFNVTPTFDGQLRRFDRAGQGTGWYQGSTVLVDGAPQYTCSFGDWKTGETFTWRSSEAPAAAAAFAEEAAKVNDAVAARQLLVAAECNKVWDAAIQRGDSPYLVKKLGAGCGLMGTRLWADDPSITLVPARDLQGNIWGLQRITPTGQKYFTEGMRIKGCAFYFGKYLTQGPAEALLCEGPATGASLFLAKGKDWNGSVLSCFNASNMVHVAKGIWDERGRGAGDGERAELGGTGGAGTGAENMNTGPGGPVFILAADNDQWTTKPSGAAWNPGMEYAEKAAGFLGAEVRAPRFKSLDGRPTDWNDLHAREGLAEVRGQLDAPQEDGAGEPASALGREPRALPPRRTAQGKPAAPSQQSLVDHLIDHFDGNLLKQDRDLFWYTGTHWQWLRLAEHDRIKQTIQTASGRLLNFADISATFNLLMTCLPAPPFGVDLFAPNPFTSNFLNGTLHLSMGPAKVNGSAVGSGDGYELVFAPHARHDYLANVLPYEYRVGDSSRNTEFDSMMARLFHGEPDQAEKVRAIAQMFGACLMPAFPRLFMLHGKSGSGKSTVLQIARRMVSPANISHVPPSEFHGFNMETMAGKLVNIDTDIPLDQPIQDAIVKKIIERCPMRVRRKGIKDLEVPLPSVHLFGGNSIPRALDGASGAHTRRWTFIEFEQFQPSGQYRLEYWNWCFDQGPQGVLNFAIRGLQDLCAAKGHFVQPSSGAEELAEWQLESDPVGQFLKDLSEGEVVESQARLILGPGVKIERRKLWAAFTAWFSDFAPGRRVMGKTTFYKALRRKKFALKKIRGVEYFAGVGVESGSGGDTRQGDLENAPSDALC